MTRFLIEVNGTKATDVADVEYERTEGESIGSAQITVSNTDSNRSLFESGADVVVKREDTSNPGTFDTEWTGEVTSKPSNSNRRNATLEVTAETKAGQLEYGKVGRPFIQTDSGDIVRQAVEEVVEPETSTEFVTTGDAVGSWSSDANVFELANIAEKSLNDFGADLLYADFAQGETGEWYIRNTSVGASILPGRRIRTLVPL